MKRQIVKLNEIDKLEYNGKQTTYKTEFPNLYIMVNKTKKSFMWYRTINGKTLNKTLGDIPIKEAQKICIDLSNELSTERNDRRNKSTQYETTKDITLGCAYIECYLIGRKETPNILTMKKKLRPYWKTPLKDINRKTLQGIYDNLAYKRKTPTTALHIIKLISCIINSAISEDKYQGINYCKFVKKEKQEPRTRYLSENELERYMQELEILRTKTHYFRQCSALKMLLLTGQRRSNVLSMEWDEIDIENRIWTIPKVKYKTNKTHIIPLSTKVIDLLNEIKEFQNKCHKKTIYIFDFKRSHLQDVGKTHDTICRLAIIKTRVTIHDLRRTTGSTLINKGVSLNVVSKLLGHSDTRITEKVYAHLNLDSQRSAVELMDSIL